MSDAANDRSDDAGEDELPEETVDEAERLTRLARTAVDENERDAHREKRAEILGAHEFTSRIREDEDGDVLVLHPAEWLEDGTIRTDRIEDVSRAVEIPLEGTGDPDDWSELDAENRRLVEAVREEHGDVHGDNAAALADFMGNHYARPIASATADEITEFLTEYFVRNAWPSEKQRAVVDESIRLVFETADEPVPEFGVQYRNG
ncbi:rnhA operon protein [Natribaculum luteum]|uniref:RnhA operon protein n=1 Tax=Natribaculum luteum TaxID=1586232 RepID=A0ABD5NUL2_9EURY|nr:rnhA operon protein [Natribaculum luteum]